MLFQAIFLVVLSTPLLGFSINPGGTNLTFQTIKNAFQSFQSSLKSESHSLAETESDLSGFQTILKKGPIPTKDRQFIIQGWRWHTISVLRDLDRFNKVIECINKKHGSSSEINSSTDKLNKCFDFVFKFNWNALMAVERDIFFPWLSNILPTSSQKLMTDIIDQHTKIRKLTSELQSLCQSCDVGEKNVDSMKSILLQLNESARDVQYTQENYLVPYVAAYIDKREQSKFNRKVLSSLGLLNSQIHLVSMLEAIKDNPREMELFKKNIPSVARSLVPFWRSQFYMPRTTCFHDA